jgi:hypothetical protein
LVWKVAGYPLPSLGGWHGQTQLICVGVGTGMGRYGHDVLQILKVLEFFAPIQAQFFGLIAFVAGFAWRRYHLTPYVVVVWAAFGVAA